MISLDPEFVGSLVPPSKLTTAATMELKPQSNIPFARLPRLERLRVQGKADETEEVADNSDGADDHDPNRKAQSKEEREKKKMRGKGKSLKRFVILLLFHDFLGLKHCG
jgi:U3 small nucleolar RNA-associated protein 7